MCMQEEYFVYAIIWPEGEVYIGCTNNIPNRINGHWNTRPMAHVHRWWASAGVNPEVRVVEKCSGRSAALVRERYWIMFFAEHDPDYLLNVIIPSRAGIQKRMDKLANSLEVATWHILYYLRELSAFKGERFSENAIASLEKANRNLELALGVEPEK